MDNDAIYDTRIVRLLDITIDNNLGSGASA